MRVTFVTGVSCAGKTTVGTELRGPENDNDRLTVWDLDEDAPARPRTAWLDWLRWRAAEHLHTVTERSEAGEAAHHYVVTGIVSPLRLIESPAWRPAAKAGVEVEFVLLDPPWKALKARLSKRLADKPKGERRETIAYNRDLRPVLRSQVEAVRGGYILRGERPVADVAVAIVDGDLEADPR